ncbi:hypothetical protein FDP41_006879 [Naegleria fowleri]|uniref:Uncharacterized protein n=1 Tax=Naegleria fowleri TaxID=5763 RepID=A0A6A5BMX7_NAEFO|nr:uncharacterized protein FDP41_006879 [Naegleria fowleri]KAF0974269.1 hypothetical protein FDP41_006879 [Naegleria fowleri]
MSSYNNNNYYYYGAAAGSSSVYPNNSSLFQYSNNHNNNGGGLMVSQTYEDGGISYHHHHRHDPYHPQHQQQITYAHQQPSMNSYSYSTHNPHHHHYQIQQQVVADQSSFISIDYYNENDFLEKEVNSNNNTTSRKHSHQRRDSFDSSTTHTSVASSVASSTRASSVRGISVPRSSFEYSTSFHPSNNTTTMNPQQQQPNSSYYYRPQAQHPSSSIHIPTPSPPNVPSSSSRIVPSLNTQLITHYQAYESLETDSSVDVCPVKDDHIWMIDNLVTIEEAEQLIDIYQDISRRKAELLLQQQLQLQLQKQQQQQQQRNSHYGNRVASSSASSKLPRKGPSSNDILANTTVPASPASSIMSNTNTVPTFHNYMMNNNENGINFENRVQHIEYTNEEFANFIFEQLKDVLPPNQSKVFGEKIGRTFELSCINETFSIYELRPGEKIDKSKGEDKCRIIEVESEVSSTSTAANMESSSARAIGHNMHNSYVTNSRYSSNNAVQYTSMGPNKGRDNTSLQRSIPTITERYHEKSFLTCVICLKGVVNTAQNESNQRLFGINLYDMSKERPEHFVVLDHVGKSCLFSDNAQLFEVIENFGTENIYLLVVNVMYRSKISSNQPLSSKSSDATCTLEQDSQNGVLNVTEENQQTQQFSGYTNDPYGDEHYLELESQKKKKKSNVSKYVLLAFGTGMVVLTSLFIQGGRVNKPIVAKLLSIISKHLNI